MEVIGIPSNLQSGYISYINLTQIKVNNNPIKHKHTTIVCSTILTRCAQTIKFDDS
jgi:hypothetical protein